MKPGGAFYWEENIANKYTPRFQRLQDQVVDRIDELMEIELKANELPLASLKEAKTT
ncbi:hypothetical protein Amet_0380 [Alkaliphilus metalliredigens QYMF]|uniref:Uncharacterized protein n=1 Tax=Alkaliphilus metalliredigens (strain QYMF) TaxID=293826 RepID=A6TK91_ALKMQ|nr:hypothetical protein [Alkaliphilus metalliredigens]ABR46609.1 hypothetical protein Amet_0380 [Alkaliphilus metalliredigens QYMF]